MRWSLNDTAVHLPTSLPLITNEIWYIWCAWVQRDKRKGERRGELESPQWSIIRDFIFTNKIYRKWHVQGWPHVVEVVVLPRDKHPPYVCHQYSILLYRKGKWRITEAKAEAKGRLGRGWENKRKDKKGRRKTPLSIRSIGTEEYMSLVIVNLEGLSIW